MYGYEEYLYAYAVYNFIGVFVIIMERKSILIILYNNLIIWIYVFDEMEEIIEKYNKECAVNCKLASGIWKVSIIVFIIAYFYLYHCGHNAYLVAGFGAIFLFLIFISTEIIFMHNVSKDLGIDYSFKEGFSVQLVKKVNKAINMYQKAWITSYCKKRKINSFDKLSLILQELKDKERKWIKYVDWTVISGILYSLIPDFIKEILIGGDFTGKIIHGASLILIISIIFNVIRSEFEKFREMFNSVNAFSTLKRLEELFFYMTMKCKR